MLLNELFSQLDEVGGVGVVAGNKKMARDPRYSMSQTVDIGPGETQKQAAKFGNKTDKLGVPPRLRADGKVTEAAMSVGIQGRHPVSAGARGLMAARWKYDKVIDGSNAKNLDNATARLAHRLGDIDHETDYDSIDNTMQEICMAFHINPKELHDAFIARYNLTPDKYSVKMKHVLKNRPKSV
jgi:hypothetical protein